MRLITANILGLCTLLAAGVIPAAAQGGAQGPSFKDAFLSQLKDTESKVAGLAQAMPQEKYTWRPGPGVRSISEVYMHIAGANYMFVAMLGAKPPSGLALRDFEKVTDKAKVVEAVKASFEFARNAVEAIPDAEMAKATKMFGQPATYQSILFFMANHMHEHLGQSIAYARTNGVIPPWSQKENQAADEIGLARKPLPRR